MKNPTLMRTVLSYDAAAETSDHLLRKYKSIYLLSYLLQNTTKQTRLLPNRSAMTRKVNAAVIPICAAYTASSLLLVLLLADESKWLLVD